MSSYRVKFSFTLSYFLYCLPTFLYLFDSNASQIRFRQKQNIMKGKQKRGSNEGRDLRLLNVATFRRDVPILSPGRQLIQPDGWSGESEENVTVQIHSSLPLKPIHFLPPLYVSIHLNQLLTSIWTHAFYRNVATFVHYAACERPSFEGQPP
jgi:hypothetical protein